MKITGCYIVKNEENNIIKSINSIKTYCDEVIVVDTGSTDETVNKARTCGAQVHFFNWCEDFSAARNYALSLVRGDWIIFLDADEYYEGAVSLREYIELIAARKPNTDAIMVNRLANSIDGKLDGQEVRIFRNTEEIRYQGIIHETLCKKNGALNIVCAEDINLVHTGYNENIIASKLNRNLHLLKKSVSIYGELPFHYYYLAECYFGLQDYEQALRYINKALSESVKYPGKAVSYYHILLESMRQCSYPLDEQEKVAKKAAGMFPINPEFYGELGMIQSSKGNFQEARFNLMLCVKMYHQQKNIHTLPGYMDKNTMARVCARLTRVCIRCSLPIAAEIAGCLAKALSATIELEKECLSEWENMSRHLIANLDEVGINLYKNITEETIISECWHDLHRHIAGLEKSLNILLVPEDDLSAAECSLRKLFGDGVLREKAVTLLRQVRDADAWLLVHSAVKYGMELSLTEQIFMSNEEKFLWQVLSDIQQ